MNGSGFSLGVPNTNILRRLSTHQTVSDNENQHDESARALDDIISNVSMEWKELVSDDSNTLEVALSLMDNSSIGKAKYYARFEGLKSELQEMLKLIVNGEYYRPNYGVFLISDRQLSRIQYFYWFVSKCSTVSFQFAKQCQRSERTSDKSSERPSHPKTCSERIACQL